MKKRRKKSIEFEAKIESDPFGLRIYTSGFSYNIVKGWSKRDDSIIRALGKKEGKIRITLERVE